MVVGWELILGTEDGEKEKEGRLLGNILGEVLGCFDEEGWVDGYCDGKPLGLSDGSMVGIKDGGCELLGRGDGL